MKTYTLVTTALAVLALSAGAQEADLAIRPPADSTLARARQLVLDDKGAEGRRLVDSVLAAAAGDDSAYAEALFWRGALAGTAADAERSYRRLLIEAPLSMRAEEALLQLAQLVHARGDRKTAADHLYRYMVTYGPSAERPARPRVSLWLVRLLFEQNQLGRGCEAVRMGHDAIPGENVELRNQLDAYEQRCAGVEVAQQSDSAKADTVTKADTATKKAPPREPRGNFYSVQVAAYDSREAAARMAETLASRGLDARVDGTTRPFRVRIGKFATRAEAVKLAQTLKGQGQNGFVTMVTAR